MVSRFLWCAMFALTALVASGQSGPDDPPAEKAAPQGVTQPDVSEGQDADTPEAPSRPKFVLKDEVRDALFPLFSTIAEADVSRVTAELSAESALGGEIVESKKSTYQIASHQPVQFTVYLKESEQRTRIYSDGKSMAVALAPDAYFLLPEPMNTQRAAVELPVPMGPYPEPIMALSLAGVDPAISLLGGMKSVEIVDREKFRGRTPSIHLRGVQRDSVTWDLWIDQRKPDEPRPLRLLVDLTAMLMATEQVQVPENFSYRLRIDFLQWRMSGEVDPKLFEFSPPKGAVEYKSLADYYESMAGVVAEHPLLGKKAPTLVAETLDGSKVDAKDLADKVVIVDFWATWCAPCVAAIPVLKEVSDQFADKDVVFYAVNTGEATPKIKAFLEEQKWDLDVLIDPDGNVAEQFQADAIPQTIIIGKGGIIESVHIGFAGAENLKKRLTEELEVLSVGGQIASAQANQ